MNATSVSPIRLGIIGCFLLLSYLALFPSWPEDFGLKSKPPSQDFCTPLPADRPVPPDTLTQPLGHNRLHLGQTAPEGSTKISILPAEEFDGWTRAQVLERRIAEVNKHSSLLVNSYAPAREIFGEIVDGRPWWGTLGQFLLYSYDGKPQTDSIAGPSEESRQILNPFVLLWPELHSVWYLLQATGP
ncbi:MAG: hypothetical protein QY326_05005 [Bdellovibrionota bacterium]|nr:MAG: hypothetical protein QY326_05005 [Bdellovibrionota bacterium]